MGSLEKHAVTKAITNGGRARPAHALAGWRALHQIVLHQRRAQQQRPRVPQVILPCIEDSIVSVVLRQPFS